jgi:glycosyltransferase involved in cell wall biosynthesis
MIPTRLPHLSLSVVIPVYRSEQTLQQLVTELQSTLSSLVPRYELILVSDASPDRSWALIEDLSRKHRWVRGLNLMRNFGQHNALLCGIREARGDVIITMDDDLQHPPEEIPLLLGKLEEGFDVVYGTPRQQQHGFARNLASLVTKLALQSVLGAETARNASAFRAFRTSLREAFANYNSPSVSIDVLLAWATTRFGFVTVRHDPRRFGPSGYSLGKLIMHAVNMITGFSTLPLRIASFLGFFFTAFGIVLFVYVVGRYLITGSSVPGFPFLASAIAIFSGVQLFALGIIGEYLARMHVRILGNPVYVIRTRTPEEGRP